MKIIEVKENKKQYLDLLLLADEQEDMVDRYLDNGKMYVLDDNGVKCECVITDKENDILEIKNIATVPEYQGKGYARALIEFIVNNYREQYAILQVGTGDSPLTIPFYEKCGFVRSHIISNFFEFIMITVFFCCSMKLKLICIPEIFQFIHIFPTKYFGDSPYREKKLRTIIFPLIFRCQSTAEQYHMNVRVEVHFRAPCMKDADITNGSSKVLWV